ncbi:MAG: helix-turn-helix domain-containing protein, partial [Zoogloeaceae bacterium]|nr:helix-turn-helix domain-containing protein [Zoogloeaceae bacterium]
MGTALDGRSASKTAGVGGNSPNSRAFIPGAAGRLASCRLSQEEAAELLGMCARSFRRYLARYEADGEAGLLDRRLEHRSARGASADEVLALQEQYRAR